MEIVEVIKPKENEPISKIEIFEVANLDEDSLNKEKEENNKPKNKAPLDLEKLVQPLESKINPYNIWKDLTTIIGKPYIV